MTLNTNKIKKAVGKVLGLDPDTFYIDDDCVVLNDGDGDNFAILLDRGPGKFLVVRHDEVTFDLTVE